MSGSDLGKPIMITNPDSPSADAFRILQKMLQHNVVFLQQNLQEEMESENLKMTTETTSNECFYK